MKGERVERTAGDEDDGVRLDRFIADLLESRSQAQKAIADGRVTINGERVIKSRSIQTGPARRP